MLSRGDVLLGSAAALLSAELSTDSSAYGQAIGKPVHLIVGFPAGGGTDVIARIVAEKIKGTYAATAIVENRPGAAARIAIDYVKNAEPDGSIILFTPDFPMTVYPHSFKTLNYDPLKHFIPVSPAAKSALTYCIGPAVPQHVRTLADFLEWCRSNPNNATFATTAAGGTPHFTGVMLAEAARVSMTPVHYKGGAPALQDLIGGHVTSSINPISETLPFAKSGSIRILAVSGPRRSSFLPDVPTIREAGYDVTVEAWLGAFVPAKTPVDIVKALNTALRDTVRSPDTIEKLATFGNEPAYQSPEEFSATIQAELARWAPVVRASGFSAD
jgi:tripartite-type tricarboxylate transporter receptor subunit TctC